MPEFSVKPNGTGVAPVGARAMAADALDDFTKQARTFLDLSARLKAAEDQVRHLGKESETARLRMSAARGRLDAEMAGLAGRADVVAPPKTATVKTRAELKPKPCSVCGQTFTPDRCTQIYCSAACNRRAVKARGDAKKVEVAP